MNKLSALIAFASSAALTAAAPIAFAQTMPTPVAKAEMAMTPGPRFVQRQKVSVAHGEKIFVEYCAVCHGLQGKGDGPRAAFFADIQYIPDLTLEGFLDNRDRELLTNIREGLARYDEPAIVMPQFKYILGENDIQSALAYVKTFAIREAKSSKRR
jgi:mono/diheme cytochrome c family protein